MVDITCIELKEFMYKTSLFNKQREYKISIYLLLLVYYDPDTFSSNKIVNSYYSLKSLGDYDFLICMYDGIKALRSIRISQG